MIGWQYGNKMSTNPPKSCRTRQNQPGYLLASCDSAQRLHRTASKTYCNSCALLKYEHSTSSYTFAPLPPSIPDISHPLRSSSMDFGVSAAVIRSFLPRLESSSKNVHPQHGPDTLLPSIPYVSQNSQATKRHT